MSIMVYAPVILEVIRILFETKENFEKQLEESGISKDDTAKDLQNLSSEQLKMLSECEKSGVLKDIKGKDVIFAVTAYGIPFASALMKVVKLYMAERRRS